MTSVARTTFAGLTAVVVSACLVLVPGTAAEAAKVRRATSDFNGDGFQDLVFGSPYVAVNGKSRAGSLTVVYGGKSGLEPARRQTITRDSPFIPGSASKGDAFGGSFAAGDFDRDGFADLAIPLNATVAGVARAGSVTVLYGSRRGLTAGPTILNPEPGLDDPDQFSQDNRFFGDNPVAGNIDGRGPDELVVFAGTSTKGARWVYQWASRSRRMPIGTKVAGYPDRNFPHQNRLTDMTGDGKADLVTFPVNAPNRLAVRSGSATGAAAIKRGPVLNGTIYASAAGDLNGDGRSDLALGLMEGMKGRQVVRIIYGAPGGFGRMQTIRPVDIPAKFRKTYLWEHFGLSLAIGDVNGDGRADLAIGANKATRRRETGQFMPDAGAVLVLRGSPRGVNFTGAQAITQDTKGVPGAMWSSNFFGHRLSLIDHNRDGRADLTVKAFACEGSPKDSLIVLPGHKGGVIGTGARRINGPHRTCGSTAWANVLLS